MSAIFTMRIKHLLYTLWWPVCSARLRVYTPGGSVWSSVSRLGACVALCVLLCCMPEPAGAQLIDKRHLIDVTDTAVPPVSKLYTNLQQSAAERSWTKEVHSWFFREPPLPRSLASQGSVDNMYQHYSGKIIGKVNIVVLAPFGTNVDQPDTSTASNWFTQTSNKMHAKTRDYIVRNNLLFAVGDQLNPLNIAESEALLRNLGFVNDVSIRIDKLEGCDEVAVTVVLRDNWPIGMRVYNPRGGKVDVETFNRNFLGTGSGISTRLLYNPNYHPSWGYGGGYFYRNIQGSFIDVNASYFNRITEQETGWTFERRLQPTNHYFGQVSTNKIRRFTQVDGWDSISPTAMRVSSISLGRAFDVGQTKEGRRMTLAVRYLMRTPTYPACFAKDTLPYANLDNQMVLVQWSLFRQRFYREQMLNSFGMIENIAFGYNLSAQAGYSRWLGFTSGGYVSLQGSKGLNYASGNYFTQASISSFFNHSGGFQGVVNARLRYFTPLFKLGSSRFRQFVTIDYSKSLNPYPNFINNLYFSTLTHINTSQSNTEVYGHERLMITAESNLFTPLYIADFRCMFYVFQDMGWLGMGGRLICSANFSWGMGLGLRVRNDLLVFRTVDIKVGWYPSLNQQGLGHFVNMSGSDPRVSPNFVPDYPQEIPL